MVGGAAATGGKGAVFIELIVREFPRMEEKR